MVAAVCQAFGWQCGAIWQANRARKEMRCVGTWHAPGLPIEEFTAATQASSFERGVGLPGRVWATREPAWIPDVTADENFPRAAVAERVGLHAAFALPIMQGRRVQGVMEFFSQQILQPSPDLLNTMTTICNQIAHLHRAAVGQRGFRSLLHAVTRSVLRRDLRWLFPPPESGVGNRPRLLKGRAPRIAVRRVRPSRRPRGHHTRAVQGGNRGACHQLREPVSHQGRILQVAPMVRVALHRAGTRSTPPRATSRSAKPPRMPCVATRMSSRWRAGAPRPRPSPRASSWRT